MIPALIAFCNARALWDMLFFTAAGSSPNVLS